MEQFPAIFIGGPPHSGKSVLTYSLTRTLRQRGIEHYVIRAAPDGEGDWANEADQVLVRILRIKGDFTPAFTDFVCESLVKRHLPLIVDAGGRPTPYQERIFDCCTHAVLLTSDADAMAHWRAIAECRSVSIVAKLISHLRGNQSIITTEPVLRGVITGLDRGKTASGPTFDALVDRLADILYCDPDELYHFHERHCSVETVIYLDRLAHTLDVPHREEQVIWEPRHLPAVLDYLPEAVPLGLYGRGPNWLYAALSLLAAPAPFVQFDVRLGWVEARSLRIGPLDLASPLQIQSYETFGYVHLEGILPTVYLDYSQLERLIAPPAPAGLGVILSGKLPLWLYTSLALTYRTAPWIAVYQPQLECAVVIYSADKARVIGECVSMSPR